MFDAVDARVHLTNDKVQFIGAVRDNKPITCDYFPPLGDGTGYTGLELLLLSLSACSATSIVAVLRKMRKTIAAFEVRAHGDRREEHPTCFHTIRLTFALTSPDTADTELQKAISVSEASLCPVWAMLKGNVDILTDFTVTTG